MTHSLVKITVPDLGAARTIGRALVEERLAASVNVIPGLGSFYWWDGAVREAEEVLLLAKTREELVASLVDFVKSRHAYLCPCVLALPIGHGNPDYLDWISAETGDQDG